MRHNTENVACGRVRKPSGWNGKKSDKWYTRDSACGVRYMCPYCGKRNLGIVYGAAAKQMHYASCPELYNYLDVREQERP